MDYNFIIYKIYDQINKRTKFYLTVNNRHNIKVKDKRNYWFVIYLLSQKNKRWKKIKNIYHY